MKYYCQNALTNCNHRLENGVCDKPTVKKENQCFFAVSAVKLSVSKMQGKHFMIIHLSKDYENNLNKKL